MAMTPGRRDFLKSTGLLLAFTAAPGALLRAVDARACGDLGDVDLNPWVHISSTDDVINIQCPTAEMGQGIYTSLPLLVAEELDADWRYVRVEQAPADRKYINPEYFGVQGVGGSRSTQGYWRIMRLAGAQARAILIANAARKWGVPAAECSTQPNTVVHAGSGRKMSYMEIAALEDIELDVPPVKESDLKPRKSWRLVGRDVQRLDVPLKVNGRAKYGIDVQMPGLLYASILRPPVATCPHPLYGDGSENGPLTVDETAALKIEGVQRVVKLPHGVAVVGSDYWATVKGKRALKVTWKQDSLAARYDSEVKLAEWSKVAQDPAQTGKTQGDAGDFQRASAAGRLIAGDYYTEHVHHACMEPFNATAWMLHNDMEVWAPTQGQTWAQEVAGKATGIEPDKVRVHTTFLGGGFGAKTEQLPVSEAATLAKIMDKPVKVIWSREDDVRHGAYRPLTAQHMRAVLDGGKVTGWSHRLVADSVLVRARKVVWDKNPGLDTSVAVGQVQPYRIPNKHHEYVHRAGGVPVGYWNAVGNGFTIFAAESFMDEVAAALGKDPLALRLELIEDKRGRGVIEAVARMAEWGRRRTGGRALGIAYNNGARWNSQIAEVAEVSVDKASGEIRVHKIWAAVDPATAIQPRHLVQQIETGIIWGLSSALKERVTLRNGQVQQSNFYDYPVLRMDEVPEIEIKIVESGAEGPSGVGQIGVPPVAPAVANAVFAATGVRIRRIPMLAPMVKQALADPSYRQV